MPTTYCIEGQPTSVRNPALRSGPLYKLLKILPASFADAAAAAQHSERDDILCSRDEFGKPGQTSNLPSLSIMPVDALPGSDGFIHERA